MTREPSYREVSARQQCVYEGHKGRNLRSAENPTLAPYNQPARRSAKRLRSYGHFRKCEEYLLSLPAHPITVNQVELWLSVNVADSVIQLSGSVKILWATLDSSLTMGPHTKTLSKSCFHHIRSFRQIRSSIDHLPPFLWPWL